MIVRTLRAKKTIRKDDIMATPIQVIQAKPVDLKILLKPITKSVTKPVKPVKPVQTVKPIQTVKLVQIVAPAVQGVKPVQIVKSNPKIITKTRMVGS